MSDFTINSTDILDGEVKIPFEGAIVGELRLDAASRPSGAAVLSLLGRQFTCTVVADPSDSSLLLSGDDGGFWTARVVAGAGGLGKPIDPQEWAQGVVVQQVLTAILDASGEAQADDIDPALLGRSLPQWSISAGTAGGALAALAEFLGVLWRIRADGLVWLGVSTPAVATSPDYIIVAPGAEAGQAVWDLNTATVDVDQIIDGLTLRQVIYSFRPGQMRALVTFAPGPVNALYSLVQQWLRRIGLDYYRELGGRIAAQNDSTSVQFQPDDSRYSPLRKVGLRFGLPDTAVSGALGRAVAGWEGATPAGPVVAGFGQSPDSQASKIQLAASATPLPVGRKGDNVDLGSWQVTLGAGAVVAVIWTPPGGGAPITLTANPLPLTGKISSGSSIVEAGG